MLISDRVTGLSLAALGVLAAYGGSRLPPVPGQQVGPNVFPMVVGGGLVLCGLMIALRVGHSFEVAEAEGEPVPAADAAARSGWWALLPPGLLLFYVFASEPLGFVPTAALIALIASISLGGSLRLAVPVAAGAAVGLHLVFAKLLRVPLPAGLLPMPW
jgi:putative tricarboxylic transport membrane protein